MDRATAKTRVEQEIAHNIELVLHDWALYQSAKQAPLTCDSGTAAMVAVESN